MNSQKIKKIALQAGFDACGIAKCEKLEQHSKYIADWLEKGYSAGMEYMKRYEDKRIDPSLLLENCRSVIVLLMSYNTDVKLPFENPKIARYAYSYDYHDIIKEKLKYIAEKIGGSTRVFVDTAPILEREWARRAGLGWIGKNGMLINKELGSFTFIGIILTDLEMEYNQAEEKEYCGNCTKCIDACPNKAIVAPKVIDSNLCNSYHTIESKDKIPDYIDLGGYCFGCDICQTSCPHNNKARVISEDKFSLHPALSALLPQQWSELPEERFRYEFKKSPISRAGIGKLKESLEKSKNQNQKKIL